MERGHLRVVRRAVLDVVRTPQRGARRQAGRRVYVGATLEEETNHGRVVSNSCAKQRSFSNPIHQVGIRPLGDEEFDGIQVTRSSRKAERSRAESIPRLNVGPF